MMFKVRGQKVHSESKGCAYMELTTLEKGFTLIPDV